MRQGMAHCAHCGVIHYINMAPAVFIKGQYFCRPSCHNNFHRKEQDDETHTGTAAGRVVRHPRPG